MGPDCRADVRTSLPSVYKLICLLSYVATTWYHLFTWIICSALATRVGIGDDVEVRTNAKLFLEPLVPTYQPRPCPKQPTKKYWSSLVTLTQSVMPNSAVGSPVQSFWNVICCSDEPGKVATKSVSTGMSTSCSYVTPTDEPLLKRSALYALVLGWFRGKHDIITSHADAPGPEYVPVAQRLQDSTPWPDSAEKVPAKEWKVLLVTAACICLI